MSEYPSVLLARYEAMSVISQHMLEAAKQRDLDRFVALELSRSAIEEELRKKDNFTWPMKESKQKATLIQIIFTANAETKALSASWMADIRRELGSIGVEQKLRKAYQSP